MKQQHNSIETCCLQMNHNDEQGCNTRLQGGADPKHVFLRSPIPILRFSHRPLFTQANIHAPLNAHKQMLLWLTFRATCICFFARRTLLLLLGGSKGVRASGSVTDLHPQPLLQTPFTEANIHAPPERSYNVVVATIACSLHLLCPAYLLSPTASQRVERSKSIGVLYGSAPSASSPKALYGSKHPCTTERS